MAGLLAWATDIHLDHCDAEVIAAFAHSIRLKDPKALCLTGDLAESQNVASYLSDLAAELQIPVYFILGNHDYYHGSIAEVRRAMLALSQSSEWLRWMPASGLVPLSATTCLLGHDGWSDGRHGDYATSTIKLKDYRLISEFAEAGEAGRLALLNQLGDEAATWLRPRLNQALQAFQQVYLLMHPPPFRAACLYGTEVADDNWAPHFTCKAVGDLLAELLPLYPQSQLTVLAGHTHNPCDIQILPNLSVRVGAAEYGAPALAACFEIA